MNELLTIENDPKSIRGMEYGVETGMQYFRPHTQSGIVNVCALASEACAIACLNTAGRGAMASVQNARQARTELFMLHREQYFTKLIFEIARLRRKAERRKMIPALRLNATSDVLWERTPIRINGVKVANSIMELFPDIQFYDYTKYPYAKRPTESLPSNYDLTFSRSESNEHEVLENLRNGRRVAVVYSTKPHGTPPKRYTAINGSRWKVINGDLSDIRFNDPNGVVVHLYAKGKAKKDTSGFVVQRYPND
jgi:hypothetical protein